MGFSKNLRKIRIEKKMSQKDLAARAGVSQTAIYQWEKGIRAPKFEAVAKLAGILEVSLSDLIGWEQYDEWTMGKEADANSQTVEKLAQNIAKFHGGKAKLNNAYDKLNTVGKNKAIEQVEMLTKIPEYQKKPEE